MSETDPLLPISVGPFDSDSTSLVDTRPTPKHVLKIALRVKELIDIIIPITFKESVVIKPDSQIINESVIELVREAAGGKGDGVSGSSSAKYRACLIFVLLTVKRWYDDSADQQLFDASLYHLRASAAEAIAQRLIEEETDERYLFRDMLCSRYSITLHGEDSEPASALELAVDLHSTAIIATSGYQRCITWLWRGWIIQDSLNPNEYVFYKELGTNNFWTHFTPDRLKTPNYQNYIQLSFCFIYLILFTLTINTLSKGGDFDIPEGLFYVFTFGEIVDDIMKAYELGFSYIGFWNLFNDFLYALVTISLGFRLSALQHNLGSETREATLLIAYRLLACCAPFVWLRILLFLESLQFFGVMLVCLSQMIRESVIFFVLLLFLCCGFLQAFIGLDASDGSTDINVLGETIRVMLLTLMSSPNFNSLNSLAWPYGKILYYLFTFIVTSLLLNILIALFGSAYGRVYDNAIDEYLALQAERTLRFIRAPDSYVYVPPLNIIELFVMPFKTGLTKHQYQKLNYSVMYIFYWPILFVTAYFETQTAQRVKYNRMKGMDDDANELDQEWDLLDGYRADLSPPEEEDTCEEAVARRRIANSKRTRQLSNNISNHTSVEMQQMENAIKYGDPEFHIDEQEWQRKVLRSAPKIELGARHGSGWENYWLVKEFHSLKHDIDTLKTSICSDSLADKAKTCSAVEEPKKSKSQSPVPEILDSTKPSNENQEDDSKKGIFLTKEELGSIIGSAVSQAVEKALASAYEENSETNSEESDKPESRSSPSPSGSGSQKTNIKKKPSGKKNKGRIARKVR